MKLRSYTKTNGCSPPPVPDSSPESLDLVPSPTTSLSRSQLEESSGCLPSAVVDLAKNPKKPRPRNRKNPKNPKVNPKNQKANPSPESLDQQTISTQRSPRGDALRRSVFVLLEITDSGGFDSMLPVADTSAIARLGFRLTVQALIGMPDLQIFCAAKRDPSAALAFVLGVTKLPQVDLSCLVNFAQEARQTRRCSSITLLGIDENPVFCDRDSAMAYIQKVLEVPGRDLSEFAMTMLRSAFLTHPDKFGNDPCAEDCPLSLFLAITHWRPALTNVDDDGLKQILILHDRPCATDSIDLGSDSEYFPPSADTSTE